MLEHQLESKLYQRQGKAIANFEATLPKPQSDLAHQILKDPYIFDFLSLEAEAKERDLEKALLVRIRDFRNQTIAEYALRDVNKPIAIARYQQELPEELRAVLPSVAQLEVALGKIGEMVNGADSGEVGGGGDR